MLIKINENINQYLHGNHTYSAVAIVGRVQIQEFGKNQRKHLVRINWPYGIYKQCLVNVIVYFAYIGDFIICELCVHILYIRKIYNKHTFLYERERFTFPFPESHCHPFFRTSLLSDGSRTVGQAPACLRSTESIKLGEGTQGQAPMSPGETRTGTWVCKRSGA